MKVYLVMISHAEGCSFLCACESRELAEKELFKERDKIISQWKEQEVWEIQTHKDYLKETGVDVPVSDMYPSMIKALSGSDYEKWNNYPHECPFILETEVISAQSQELLKGEV